MSEIILGCAFLPLFKGGFKKPDEFSSYRGIAGSLQLLKLFEYVILIIWGQNLKSDSLQFGFKEKCSTTHCTWIVSEVCGYFNRRNTDMYITLLDCTKAFDLCKFSDLFMKLSEKLPLIVVRCLLSIYEEQTGVIKLIDQKSENFKISNGTRQGSVLSPVLWSIYMDDIFYNLRKKNWDVILGECGWVQWLMLMT